MYKEVYTISKWNGKRSNFHKKYYVFDGLGMMFFDSLIECRSYVRIKSLQLKNTYQQATKIFLTLSDYHVKKIVRFRENYSQNGFVCDSLTSCLWLIKRLSLSRKSEYRLTELKKLLDNLLNISKALEKNFLTTRILHLIDSFFVPYPEYCTDNKEISKQTFKNKQKKKTA